MASIVNRAMATELLTGGSSSVSGTVAALAGWVVSVDTVVPLVSTVVNVTAQAVDQFGLPFPGVRTATWSKTGGGTLGSSSTSTSSAGVATNTMTVSATGGDVETVSVSDGSSHTGTSATITTLAGSDIDSLILALLAVADGGSGSYDNGYVDVFETTSGFPAPGSDTLLATARLDTPAAPVENLVDQTDIVLNLADDTPTILADSDFSNPKYFRVTKSDHTSGAIYGSIGLVSDDFDPDLIVNVMTWVAGYTLNLSGVVHARSLADALTGYAVTPSTLAPFSDSAYTATVQARSASSNLHRIGIPLTTSLVTVSGTGGGVMTESSVATNRYGVAPTIHVVASTYPTTEKIHVTDGTLSNDSSNVVVVAAATFTLMDHTFALSTSSGSGATTGNFDTTGAKLITIGANCYAGGPPVVSDSYGNTWVPRKTGISNQVVLFDCINPTCGPGHNFSVGGSALYASLVAAWFSAPSPVADATNGAEGTDDIKPGAVTPAVAHELLVTVVTFTSDEAAALSVDDGFTVIEDHKTSNSVGLGLAYLIQTVAAAADITWANPRGSTAALIATYKAA